MKKETVSREIHNKLEESFVDVSRELVKERLDSGNLKLRINELEKYLKTRNHEIGVLQAKIRGLEKQSKVALSKSELFRRLKEELLNDIRNKLSRKGDKNSKS